MNRAQVNTKFKEWTGTCARVNVKPHMKNWDLYDVESDDEDDEILQS